MRIDAIYIGWNRRSDPGAVGQSHRELRAHDGQPGGGRLDFEREDTPYAFKTDRPEVMLAIPNEEIGSKSAQPWDAIFANR